MDRYKSPSLKYELLQYSEEGNHVVEGYIRRSNLKRVSSLKVQRSSNKIYYRVILIPTEIIKNRILPENIPKNSLNICRPIDQTIL